MLYFISEMSNIKSSGIPNFLDYEINSKSSENKQMPSNKTGFCEVNMILTNNNGDGSYKVSFTPCYIRLEDISYIYPRTYVHACSTDDGTISGTKRLVTGIVFKGGNNEIAILESYEFMKSQLH